MLLVDSINFAANSASACCFQQRCLFCYFNVSSVHQVIIFRLTFLKYADSFLSFLPPFFYDHLPE